MRLLKLTVNADGSISMHLTSYTRNIPPYVILSHRWHDGSELLFDDCNGKSDISREQSVMQRQGYQKVLGACQKAIAMHCEHLWVDTCCIDKGSSAELSEAINSMYAWYEDSLACLAYLDDTTMDQVVDDDAYSALKPSVWFTRGWTLQELIAPEEVIFFDKNWTRLGTKREMAATISAITGIRKDVLSFGLSGRLASVGEIMSWARGRETTRPEDRAYSLMGLFRISMPVLYGEGNRAFVRLQHEVMKFSNDQSIFIWEGSTISGSILADSPDRFSGNVYEPVDVSEFTRQFRIADLKPDFSVTNFGIHIQIPMVDCGQGHFAAYLMCRLTAWESARISATQGEAAAASKYWPVVHLYRPEGPTAQFVRVKSPGGVERIGLQPPPLTKMVVGKPIYIRSRGDLWPLVHPYSTSGRPFLPSGLSSPSCLFVLARTRDDICVESAHPDGPFYGDNLIALSESSSSAAAASAWPETVDTAKGHELLGGWQDDGSIVTLTLHNKSTDDRVNLVLAIGSGRVLALLHGLPDRGMRKDFASLVGRDHGVDMDSRVACWRTSSQRDSQSGLPQTLRLTVFTVTIETQRTIEGYPTLRIVVGRGWNHLNRLYRW